LVMVQVPHWIRAVDGTSIKIQTPTENKDHSVDLKSYHSLNVQVSVKTVDLILVK
jgi:hypothetical protein